MITCPNCHKAFDPKEHEYRVNCTHCKKEFKIKSTEPIEQERLDQFICDACVGKYGVDPEWVEVKEEPVLTDKPVIIQGAFNHAENNEGIEEGKTQET